jgi:hypothetical protein
MTDLSHWDFANTFHIEEAAELIVGCNPEATVGPRTKKLTLSTAAKPVFNRLQESIISAITARNMLESPADGLKFLDLERSEANTKPRNFALTILDVVTSTGEEFKIRREELVRWLSATGMKSVYQFDRRQHQPVETPTGRWPWGNHHTELLGHLEAAAKRYYCVNYVPTDATTAPINKDVAEWLITERKVSQKMADSIASILRPDGLPTGPRK